MPRTPLATAIAIVLGVAATSACGGPSAYQRSVKAGQQANAAGDYIQAARHYQDACRRSGKADDAACQAAREHHAYVRDAALYAGAEPCRAGDVDACHAAVGPALGLLPGDRQLVELLDEAGDAHAATCDAIRGVEPQRTVERMQCLRGAAAAIDTPSYRERLAEARAAAAELFARIAAERELEPYPGTRFVFWDAAAEFGDVRAPTARDRAWRNFVDRAAIPVAVTLSAQGPGAPSSAIDLCAETTPGARVACRAAADAIGVQVDVTVGAMQHRRWTETLSAQYQSGTRRDRNPAYRPARRRVFRAEASVSEIEPRLIELRAACEAAEQAWWSASSEERPAAEVEKTRVCEERDGTEQAYDRRGAELADARVELANTPAFVEDPVYATHTWTVRRYEWEAAYEIAVTVGGNTSQHSGVATFTAAEQDAFAPAGIEALSRGIDPVPADVFARARADAAAKARAALVPVLDARADARAAECPVERASWSAAWLECRSEVQLWRGDRQRAAPLLTMR
jgi:hypothetical protein